MDILQFIPHDSFDLKAGKIDTLNNGKESLRNRQISNISCAHIVYAGAPKNKTPSSKRFDGDTTRSDQWRQS